MSDDLISRQAAMDEMSKQQTYKMFVGEDTVYLDANDVGSVLASLPSAQPEQHLCRDCKWGKYYGNVDKNGNVESYWYCMNWDGGTDEEGYCHEWKSR